MWDIFKNSEVIAKYHDKNLVLALAECYFYIDMAQELMDEYYEEKRKATHTIFELYTVHPHKYLNELTENRASKYFLERIVILDDYPIPYHFSLYIDLIDYIVYLIDKDGNYNEETNEKNSDTLDFDSFRKQSKWIYNSYNGQLQIKHLYCKMTNSICEMTNPICNLAVWTLIFVINRKSNIQ